MAGSFQAQAIIRQPIQQVWDRLTDWEHLGDWMRGVEAVRIDGAAGDGDAGEGATVHFSTRGKPRESEITRWDPPEALQLTSTQAGVRASYTYLLDHVTDSVTEFTLVASCHPSGAWRLVAPLLRLAMKLSDAGQPAALKKLLDPPAP